MKLRRRDGEDYWKICPEDERFLYQLALFEASVEFSTDPPPGNHKDIELLCCEPPLDAIPQNRYTTF